MQVLFDQATTVPIRAYLDQHVVSTAFAQGWGTLENGELLTAAEQAGFDVLLTTDKNLGYQQNLNDRHIAIVVLGIQRWPQLRPHVQLVVRASQPPHRHLAAAPVLGIPRPRRECGSAQTADLILPSDYQK